MRREGRWIDDAEVRPSWSLKGVSTGRPPPQAMCVKSLNWKFQKLDHRKSEIMKKSKPEIEKSENPAIHQLQKA